jgi:hypothetical protein
MRYHLLLSDAPISRYFHSPSVSTWTFCGIFFISSRRVEMEPKRLILKIWFLFHLIKTSLMYNFCQHKNFIRWPVKPQFPFSENAKMSTLKRYLNFKKPLQKCTSKTSIFNVLGRLKNPLLTFFCFWDQVWFFNKLFSSQQACRRHCQKPYFTMLWRIQSKHFKENFPLSQRSSHKVHF